MAAPFSLKLLEFDGCQSLFEAFPQLLLFSLSQTIRSRVGIIGKWKPHNRFASSKSSQHQPLCFLHSKIV